MVFTCIACDGNIVKLVIKNQLNIHFFFTTTNCTEKAKKYKKGRKWSSPKENYKEQRYSKSQTANAKQDNFRAEIVEFLKLRDNWFQIQLDYIVTLVSINRHNSIPATAAQLLIEVFTDGDYYNLQTRCKTF